METEPTKSEQVTRSRFAIETGDRKEGVCEIGLRNLKRATKRNAASLTIELPDVKYIIAKAIPLHSNRVQIRNDVLNAIRPKD